LHPSNALVGGVKRIGRNCGKERFCEPDYPVGVSLILDARLLCGVVVGLRFDSVVRYNHAASGRRSAEYRSRPVAELHIKFGQWVQDYLDDIPRDDRPNGPIFTHWLPDGERDSIQLKSDDPAASVSVWFERYGHRPDGKFLVFDKDKREADSDTIARQARLDAGPLHGRIRFQDIPDETIEVLRSGDMSDKRYEKLGKRIAKQIYSSVAPLLTLLRINYGQYWLREIEPWDSRMISVGMYCRRWAVKWSTDGTSWAEFKPDAENMVRYSIVVSGQATFKEFLTQDDWDTIRSVVQTTYSPSVASYLLHRCHRLIARGELRYALIEGMSALELAIDEYVSRKCDGPLKGEVFNDRFNNMHAVGKMALVAYMVPGIAPP
jgi:hypothetical protein